MNFPDWYKNMIESVEQDPPASVWEEIQNDLDLDKVWAGIDKELGVTRKKRKLYIFQAAASLLLLVSIGTYFLVSPGNREIAHISIHTSEPERALPPVTETQRSFAAVESDPAPVPVHETTVKRVIPGSDTPGINLAELHVSREAALKPVNSLSYKYIRQDYHLVASKEAVNEFENDIASDRSWLEFSGYYAGMSGHLGNTWLLNNKTLQGLKSDELTASLPSFGYSFGIIAGKKSAGVLISRQKPFLLPEPARITMNIFTVNM
jgi:hypothetical protein